MNQEEMKGYVRDLLDRLDEEQLRILLDFLEILMGESLTGPPGVKGDIPLWNELQWDSRKE
ncbi:MAG: hypothetical protein L3J76_02320 [Candidatus Hydrothermae bacterium]|nr:hypothetical protein [Candidatus Hydrothermae bacterium]